MYQFSYAEVLADSPSDGREQERRALDHAIDLLRAAAAAEPQGPEEEQAMTFVTQLWGIFIKDLADPGNDLPGDLRARLMSVGLWMLGEAQRIQLGQSRDIEGMADICGVIRDGLR